MRNHRFWTTFVGLLVIGLSLLTLLPGAPEPASTAPSPTSIVLTPTVSAYLTLVGRNMNQAQVPIATATPTVALTPTAPPESVQHYTYRVIHVYPHDPDAFTQGLIYEDGIFYEGTGLNGRSSLRKVEVETGNVLQRIDLPREYFGEGITIFGDRLFQLTWRSQIGFIYDKHSFEQLDTFFYPTEGWGITHDSRRLIMSDGSANLYFWDPETLTEIGRVEVRDENGPVVRLNELEYVDGAVYANVWQTNRIVIIDPGSGRVTGDINLTGLLSPEDQAGRRVDVLNGIAYAAENSRLFVTGKLWPKLYEIELMPITYAHP
jgi:glutamine cyclotransferase